jgi:hypothetical protein
VYVKVKYSSPTTNTPIPVEAYEANYTSAIMLQTGRNWMSGDGSTWNAVGNNTSWAFDLCIKMYTETAPLARFDMPDTARIHEPVQLVSNCFPPDVIDSIQWFAGGEYIGSEPVINYVFTTPGDNTVSLTAYMGSNSDTEEKIIYIKDPAISGITPDMAMQGETFTAYIQGYETSWSGAPYVAMNFSGDPSEIIEGNNIIAVAWNSIQADFNIPSDASVGDWHVLVDDLVLENGFYVDILWDIPENNFETLNIFPNPSDGILQIGISEKASLELVSITGNTIYHKSLIKGNNVLQINYLPDGLYLLKICSPDKVHYSKILKN